MVSTEFLKISTFVSIPVSLDLFILLLQAFFGSAIVGGAAMIGLLGRVDISPVIVTNFLMIFGYCTCARLRFLSTLLNSIFFVVLYSVVYLSLGYDWVVLLRVSPT